MAFKSLSLFPDVADSLFSDRFNRIDRLFSQLTGDAPLATVPAYDIKRLDESRYAITLSVPGWKENELEISATGGQLTVSGKRTEEQSQPEEKSGWLHRGISRHNFSVSYGLPQHVKVEGARLENGLLEIALYQEIPESEKPRKIAIESQQRVIEHNA
ncbi:Hsp20 family protein [Mixta intestinalis]|jgi:molecular chaperone IbpA|uniref:Small heat shock protein IbpA n=1 Tax=Mixta intestinalis TaxID=1615494 RepID=A0A6P1Q446_9GAMM|nr:Hsp20 family protein [Mixta intestinalis]QHM73403.1 Small heat shock protein IbpA [Mixta intestinalis]